VFGVDVFVVLAVACFCCLFLAESFVDLVPTPGNNDDSHSQQPRQGNIVHQVSKAGGVYVHQIAGDVEDRQRVAMGSNVVCGAPKHVDKIAIAKGIALQIQVAVCFAVFVGMFEYIDEFRIDAQHTFVAVAVAVDVVIL